MNISLSKNLLINSAIAAAAIAAFNAAPISGDALFIFATIGGIAAIAFTDYRTRRPLSLRLRARSSAVATRRRGAALVAA